MIALVVALALALAAVALLALRLRRVRGLVADAVHEVRGPLTAAGLALEAATRRGAIPAERAEGIHAQLSRAWKAVEDLAAAPRGELAADRFEPVVAAVLISDIAAAWAPVAHAVGRELAVVGDSPAVLLADPVRISQAAGNLIANALEHGEGPVELHLRDAGSRVRLEVRDAGRGLDAPLGPVGGRPGEARGRGLRIAAAIAERHHGRLVTAPSAQGARLAIELPAFAGFDTDVAR